MDGFAVGAEDGILDGVKLGMEEGDEDGTEDGIMILVKSKSLETFFAIYTLKSKAGSNVDTISLSFCKTL